MSDWVARQALNWMAANRIAEFMNAEDLPPLTEYDLCNREKATMYPYTVKAYFTDKPLVFFWPFDRNVWFVWANTYVIAKIDPFTHDYVYGGWMEKEEFEDLYREYGN